MDLKRQIYHKGALIGKDVKKLTKTENISFVSKIFSLQEIELDNSEVKTFSSHDIEEKIEMFLLKFKSCYDFCMLARPLCKHECFLLKNNCKLFGEWVKLNFPKLITKRKFQVLIKHIPQKAERSGSVGLETEEVSEAIHPVVKSLDKRYCSVQNNSDRMALIAKAQWNQSDCSLPDFKQIETRVCPKCKKAKSLQIEVLRTHTVKGK